jgi:hypothetical protein
MQMRLQSNVLKAQMQSKTSHNADAAAVERLAAPCSPTASTHALILMRPQMNASAQMLSKTRHNSDAAEDEHFNGAADEGL